MDIGQFILTMTGTIIGTLVGGFVVIFTNWINAQRTRRENVQDWFKQSYITEGIDPLITFFVDLEFHWNWSVQQIEKLDKVPVVALAKFQVLIDSDVLTWIARFVQNDLAGTKIDTDTQVTLINLRDTLLELRKELLKIIPTQVNEKNYQITLPGYQQKFQMIYRKLQDQPMKNRKEEF